MSYDGSHYKDFNNIISVKISRKTPSENHISAGASIILFYTPKTAGVQILHTI